MVVNERALSVTKCLLILSLLLLPTISWAETEKVDLDNLVSMSSLQEEEELYSLTDVLMTEVTVASTKAKSVFKSMSTVTVIDRKTIERYNYQSVAEALNTVSGFDVSRTYVKQNLPTARGILQTHYANKMLVMINNVPTWHAVTGEGNLERVNIRDVERIEVLKGPASVKYGSNSYSGAVNIVLRDQKKKSFYVGGGSDGNMMAGVRAGKGNNSFYLNLQDMDGYDFDYLDELGTRGNVEDYVKNSNFTWTHVSKNHKVLANTYRGGEGYLGVLPRNNRGAGIEHELEGRLISYEYCRDLNKRDSFKFHTSYDWNERDLARNATDRSLIAGYRFTSGLLFQRQVRKDFNWEFGWDYDSRTSQSYRNYNSLTDQNLGENNLNDKDVWEYSFFGNAMWEGKKVNSSAGIRYTKNQLFGNNTAFHLTFVRPLSETSSWKFIYAQSYRAPSLFELNFETATGTVFGDPNLEPEESTSFELSYLQKKGNLFFQSTLYRANYENKILRTRGNGIGPTGTVFTNQNHYVNGDEFAALGFEFEMRFENPKKRGVSGFLNLGYIDGEDDDRVVNGTDTGVYNFLSVPEFTASLGLQKELQKGLFASTVVNYRNGTKDTEGNDVSSVATVDLNFVKHVEKGKIAFSVKNLFDEEAWIPEYTRPNSGLTEVPGIGFTRQFVLTFTRPF